MREYMDVVQKDFPRRVETEDRFYQVLGELRRDREEQARKWEANKLEMQQWREDNEHKWEASQLETQQWWEEYVWGFFGCALLLNPPQSFG